MPVDLKRVQQQRAAYERSLLARTTTTKHAAVQEDHSSSSLAAAVNRALEARALVTELNSRRPDAESSSKKDKKERQTQLAQARANLEEQADKLPNWVDLDLLENFDGGNDHLQGGREKNSTSDESQCETTPEDPLFCLGGYQELGSDHDCVVLTGPGCELEAALASFFQDSLQSVALNCAVKRYNLPATLPQADKEGLVDREIPAWKALLQAQHGSTLWDRQLPQIHLLQCTSINSVEKHCKTKTHSTQQQSKKKQQRNPWFQKLQPAKQIEMLALTGPSLTADSRPLQRQLMECVLGLYRQLASTNDTHRGRADKSLRIRAVPAHELLPMESSRLVVEGWTTTTTTTATNKKKSKRQDSSSSPFCLASLSNLQDYCTNDTERCKIRHGGSTAKECVHVLHGTLCRIGEAMEWLCQTKATASGVALPPPLGVGQQQKQQRLPFNNGSSSQPQLWPYTRQIITSVKSGKRIVVEVATNSTNTASSFLEKQKERHDVASSDDNDDDDDEDNNNNNKRAAARIRGEALSSPFNFLPFYQC